MSKHANTDIARNAAVLLRTPGYTPESVEGILRAAAEGNEDIRALSDAIANGGAS